MARIIIDAGHGGSTRAGNSSALGARGPAGTVEKDVTLDIARQVVARLGAGARLTRGEDINLPLGARAHQAAREGADVFVSIHANSGPPDAAGPETWVHPEAGRGSRQLAEGIQGALEQLNGRYAGGTPPRLGPMAVLSPRALGGGTAACLVEVDYLSNPRSEQRLRNPAERAAIGSAIATAIREHVTQRGRLGRAVAEAAAIIVPDIDYSTASLAESNAIWNDLLTRYASWAKGVPDTALFNFPHASICQLKLYDANDNQAWGTGFYIGAEKILSCGHNFRVRHEIDDQGTIDDWTTVRVEVMPGASPRMSTFPTKVFEVDWTKVVHPKWRAGGYDIAGGTHTPGYDLSVFRVPGLPAQKGWFKLANRSLGEKEGIVVCGYGKAGLEKNDADEGQRMDGAHISSADADLLRYPIETVGGHSGSPVFHSSMVVGVHTGNWSDTVNRGVILTPEKISWIEGK